LSAADGWKPAAGGAIAVGWEESNEMPWHRPRTRSSPARLAGAALLAGLATAGCGDREAAPTPFAWPAGTVLVLDGAPITAPEVDAYVEGLRAIMPAYTLTHRRRQALINLVLPLVWGRVHHPEEREEASARAEAWRAAYLAGELVEGPGEERAGNWDILGVDVWSALRELEPNEWSEVVELPGRFVVVQLLERTGDPRGGRETFRGHVVEFPYVKHPGNLTHDCLEGRLEIVDPAWREIVPGLWKYSMKAAGIGGGG